MTSLGLSQASPMYCLESVGVDYLRLINRPNGKRVGIVVYRGKSGYIVGDGHDIQSKSSTRVRIDRQLANESAVLREFHDFAGLVYIQVDSVAIADQQVSIWSKYHRQSPMQMDRIIVD